MSIWRKKSLNDLLKQAEGSTLKRTLGSRSLVALGVDLFLETGALDFLVTLKLDGKDAKLGGDLDDEIEGIEVDVLVFDFDELE